jgi:ABC-type transporter Mla subunit MlaD
MSTERKGVEFFVGLFLLIGFGVIAAMVVIFGRVGQGMQAYYPITVEFPNASGLVKGSDVLLSGARIGVVTKAPALTGNNYAVAVELAVRDTVKIPRKSIFQIRSNGMLGDSYVDVAPPTHYDPADIAQPGERIAGTRTSGFDELTAKGSQMIDTLNSEVLKKVSAELDEIKIATASLNHGLLNDTNLKNLQETFANLKTTTDDFSKTARDLDAVVSKAQEAVDSAKGTLKMVDGAAGDLRLTLGDFRKVSDSARTLLNKATTGDGTLGTLVSDKKTAEDLKTLIANLRRSGVLFYKDRPVSKAEPESASTPSPRRR